MQYADARVGYGLLIVGIVIGNIVLGGFVTGERQIFPFFSWSLLSHVPQSSANFKIVVHSNGVPDEDVQSILEKQGIEYPLSTYNLIKQMGEAYLGGWDDFPELQERIERAYLPPGTRYSLVREDRVLPSGTFGREWTIMTFVAKQYDR